MLKFLQGNTILDSAADLIKTSGKIDIAVAFWGEGAVDELQLNKGGTVRIVCDLMSGACNPTEVARFLEPQFEGRLEAKHLSKLHAKVFLSDIAAIVGSANASTNGLNYGIQKGTIEAALKTNEPTVLAEISAWFEKQWSAASVIDGEAIKLARKVFRPSPSGLSFLEVMEKAPALLDGRVSLLYIDEQASDVAVKKFRKIARTYYTDQQLAGYDDGDGPFYELDAPASTFPGKAGDIQINGASGDVWMIREPMTVEISNDNCLVLVVDNLRDIMGFQFSKKDRLRLRKAINLYRKRGKRGNAELQFSASELPDELHDILFSKAPE